MSKKRILILENKDQRRPSIKTSLENDHPQTELISVPSPLKALQVIQEQPSTTLQPTIVVIDLDADALEVIGLLEALSRISTGGLCKILLLSDQPGPFAQQLVSTSRNQTEMVGRKAAGQRIRSMLLGMDFPV
ncbi:ANTAR domain-containing protein [Pedobacter namyangjuensis]|uniref:hypothetical protein n=1 Tax=Pedobacter namyangjuensis TaxID=600626 RepID=UPI000DE57609|nr:hypothetical protein [Pedobacter namyangjuensis]